jgi:hypothetical protein
MSRPIPRKWEDEWEDEVDENDPYGVIPNLPQHSAQPVVPTSGPQRYVDVTSAQLQYMPDSIPILTLQHPSCVRLV